MSRFLHNYSREVHTREKNHSKLNNSLAKRSELLHYILCGHYAAVANGYTHHQRGATDDQFISVSICYVIHATEPQSMQMCMRTY